MSKKTHFTDDINVFNTVSPISSSNLIKNKEKKRALSHENNTTEDPCRLSDISAPEALLDLDFETPKNAIHRSESYLLNQLERKQAMESLKRADSKTSHTPLVPELTSIPSRFLKRSELSLSNSDCLQSESTINESDLLFTNSSTPRDSILSNVEFMMKEPAPRPSHVVSQLLAELNNDKIDLDHVLDKFPDSISFQPGEEAVEKFRQAEMSWRRENDIPAPTEEFSVGENCQSKMSMGAYFQPRSFELSALLPRSPEQRQEPVPLIEMSNHLEQSQNIASAEVDSFSLSSIERILQDSKLTPGKGLDCLYKKQSKIPACRKSISSEKEGGGRRKSITSSKNTDKQELLEQVKASKTVDSKSPTLPFPLLTPIVDDKSYHKEEVAQKLEVSSDLELCESEEGDISEEMKENIDISNMRSNISATSDQHKHSFSSRSSSSLSNLPNGKLPIATTTTELVWGCIKPGKTCSQSFVIKNRASSRVAITCTLTNPSFRVSSDNSESSLNSAKMNLHPFESKTITVTFAPTTIGAAGGYLEFYPSNVNLKQECKQFIRLFGYGGIGSIALKNVIKDTGGKSLLPLGTVTDDIMRKTFFTKNTGSLPCFAFIRFVSSGLYLFSNIKIEPQCFVVLPDEEKEVVVTYTPKKEDLTHIFTKVSSPVVDMGKLTVFHGTEVDRGRLRRISRKYQEKNLKVNEAIESLVVRFPNESMPADLKSLREPVNCMDLVYNLINTKEITLTLEQDLDQSVAVQLQDQTAMFKTLCSDTIDLSETTVKLDLVSVEPSQIILTPPVKMTDIICLTNNSLKSLYFEIQASDGLGVKPSNGTIHPGKLFIVNVDCTKVGKNNNKKSRVKILVDNEEFNVDVKVLFMA